MRVSIKNRIKGGKKSPNSEPGESPKNRTGFLRKGVVYNVDRSKLYAVVGVLHQRTGPSVAGNLEHGGMTRGSVTKKGKRKPPKRMQARPFVLPGALTGFDNYQHSQHKDSL